MINAVPQSSACYCLGCGHDLKGTSERCPECGRVFDWGNTRTFCRRRVPRWLGGVKRAGAGLLAVLLLLGLIWGGYYWSWRAEQQRLEALKIPAGRVTYMAQSVELRYRLGGAGFVFERVCGIDFGDTTPRASDLEKLREFSHLTRLSLHSAAMTDAAPLAWLTDLEQLDLSGTGVRDLSPLAGLTRLETLELRGTGVTDVSPLARLSHLRTLNLQGSGMRDVAPLTGLTELWGLYLDDTAVSDLTPVARMTGLHRLGLSRTNAVDLTALSALSNLDFLEITGTPAKDFSPLAGLPLRQFFARETPVEDVMPLAKLTRLEKVWLPSRRDLQAQVEALRRALPECKIMEN